MEPLGQAVETERGSEDYKAVMDYGIALQRTGDKEKATEMLEKAYALDPEKPQPLIYLGNLYMEDENYEKVKEIGEKLVNSLPEEEMGYVFRGYGELQTKDYSAAQEAFDKATDINPQNPSAYYYKGLAMESRMGTSANSYTTLINTYAKAVNLSGDDVNPEWYYRLGHAYELESQLDWDRAERNADARARCLSNLRKAYSYYSKAGDYGPASERLQHVNERIRRLELIQ